MRLFSYRRASCPATQRYKDARIASPKKSFQTFLLRRWTRTRDGSNSQSCRERHAHNDEWEVKATHPHTRTAISAHNHAKFVTMYGWLAPACTSIDRRPSHADIFPFPSVTCTPRLARMTNTRARRGASLGPEHCDLVRGLVSH